MTKRMTTYAFYSAKKINMDKKSQFLYQFRAFFVNSNSIPIPFFPIPIPSPIPGIESGIELNSHSIPELTPTLVAFAPNCVANCTATPDKLFPAEHPRRFSEVS